MSISELKLKSQWHCESNFADGFIFYTITGLITGRQLSVPSANQTNYMPTAYLNIQNSNSSTIYYSCQLCQLLYIIESKFQRPIIGGIDIAGIYFIL